MSWIPANPSVAETEKPTPAIQISVQMFVNGTHASVHASFTSLKERTPIVLVTLIVSPASISKGWMAAKSPSQAPPAVASCSLFVFLTCSSRGPAMPWIE